MTDPEAVTEPGAVIDPEPAPSPAPARRRRRVVLAAVTALAVVAGGIALGAGDGRSEPEPLALMAGDVARDGGEGRPEMMTGANPAVAPAIGSAADSRLAYPSGSWGLRFEVTGDLPELPDQAPAWRATRPAVDRSAFARMAGALGLNGSPEQRDGGWFLGSGDWTLSAFPGGDIWSISLSRSIFSGEDDEGLVPDDPPAGPRLSPAEAERRMEDLLDRMGAPEGSWEFETAETGIGPGWACASPAPGPAMSPEELRTLELEKLRQVEQPAAPVADSATTPDGSVASCPPPPAPVEGFVVALYPRLDGVRGEWPVWHMTLRYDGRVESLSGSWVTFERGETYRLRGVSAALKELQSPAGSPARGGEGAAVDAPAIAVDPALPAAPVPPPVVTITGVEQALMQAPVFEDGRARLHLVPAYRFVGHFDHGAAWHTLVVALHPDAIAPPPDVPVTDDLPARTGGGVTGIGQAVPAAPPSTGPAVVSDPDAPR